MARVLVDFRIGRLSPSASRAVAAAAGAALLAAVAWQVPGGIASRAWPAVRGTVTRRWGRTGIEYAYDVGGRRFAASRVRFALAPPIDVAFTTRKCLLMPRAVGACRYERNDAVAVHYDPADPRRAVLEPGVPLRLIAWLALGLLLVTPAVQHRRRL